MMMMAADFIPRGNNPPHHHHQDHLHHHHRQCLFCGETEASSADRQEEEEERRSLDLDGLKTGVKLLLRYLSVDVNGLLLKKGVGGAYDHEDADPVEDVIVDSLCGGCTGRILSFWRLFQELEKIRLELDHCLKGLSDRLRRGMEEMEVMKAEEFQREELLRSEVVKKCYLAIHSIPRVTLSKTDVDNYNNNRPIISRPHHGLLVGLSESFQKNDVTITLGETILKREVFDSSSNHFEEEDGCPSSPCENDPMSPSPPPPPKSMDEEPIADETTTVIKSEEGVLMGYVVAPPPPQPPDDTAVEVHHPNPIISCVHCDHTSLDPTQHQKHVLSQHAIEVFGGDLPVGTTNEELEAVITELIRPSSHPKFQFRQECTLCRSDFPDQFDCRVHLMEFHLEDIIGELVGTHDNAQKTDKKGMDSGSATTQLKCATCHIPFDTTAALFQHDKSVHGKEPSIFCSYCFKTFTTCASLLRHCLHSHLLLTFSSCLPPTTTEAEVKQVLDSQFEIGEEGGRAWSCRHCRRRINPYQVYAHLRRKHPKEMLSQFGVYLKPMKPLKLKVTQPPKKRHHRHRRRQGLKCPICMKWITNRRSYNVHLQTHNKNSKVRENHLGQNSDPTESTTNPKVTTSQVKCEYCEVVSSNRGNYRAHLMRKHSYHYCKLLQLLPPGIIKEEDFTKALNETIGEIPLTLMKEGLYCDLCSKVFTEKSRKMHVLRKHHNLLGAEVGPVAPALPSMAGANKGRQPQRSSGGIKRKLLKSHAPRRRRGPYQCSKSGPTLQANPFPCPHCGQKAPDILLHLMYHHPLQSFANVIPPNMTEELLDKDIAGINRNNNNKESGAGATNALEGFPMKCTLCSNNDCNSIEELRTHFLRSHLPKLQNLWKHRRKK